VTQKQSILDFLRSL